MKEMIRGMAEGLILSVFFIPGAWFLYVAGEAVIEIIKSCILQ